MILGIFMTSMIFVVREYPKDPENLGDLYDLGNQFRN